MTTLHKVKPYSTCYHISTHCGIANVMVINWWEMTEVIVGEWVQWPSPVHGQDIFFSPHQLLIHTFSPTLPNHSKRGSEKYCTNTRNPILMILNFLNFSFDAPFCCLCILWVLNESVVQNSGWNGRLCCAGVEGSSGGQSIHPPHPGARPAKGWGDNPTPPPCCMGLNIC